MQNDGRKLLIIISFLTCIQRAAVQYGETDLTANQDQA